MFLFLSFAFAATPDPAFVDAVSQVLGVGGVFGVEGAADAALQAACSAGQPIACDRGWWPAGRPVDLPTLAGVSRAGCTAGDLDACLALGLALTEARPGRPSPGIATWAEGLGVLAAACGAGHARACAEQARALTYADPALEVKALDPIPAGLAQRACVAGDAVGCQLLGEAMLGGWGVPQDVAGGLAVLDEACAKGQPHACTEAARLHAKEADPALLPAAYQRACLMGSAADCLPAFEAWPGGDAAAEPAAVSFLVQGCALGEPDACAALATATRATTTDPTRLAEARRIEDDACWAGSQRACGSIAKARWERLRSGAPFPRCTAERPFDCADAAWQAEFTQTSTEQLTAARSLHEAACEAGVGTACLDLAGYHALPLGRPAAPERTADALLTACSNGAAGVCSQLRSRLRATETDGESEMSRRLRYAYGSARRQAYALVAGDPVQAVLQAGRPAVSPPAVRKRASAAVPAAMHALAIGSDVCAVRVAIDPAGVPAYAYPLRCSPLLRGATMSTLMEWRFEAAKGATDVRWYDLSVTFTIQGRTPSEVPSRAGPG